MGYKHNAGRVTETHSKPPLKQRAEDSLFPPLDSGAVETHSLEWWITLHHLVVPRTNLGLANARRTLPALMHRANCKVWWRRNNGLGLFFMVRARPFTSNEGKSLCYSIRWFWLPALWQQFWEGSFLLQNDNAPVQKARSIQKWFVEIGVEELDWPAQSPDLNPIEHAVEWRLQARPNRLTSVPDLTNALVAE
jgi:hypothetical protein